MSNQFASEQAARILILDDEPCISELLSEMLRLLGFTPTTASAPALALELLTKEDFDVILSDFRMPGMNGDEFFARATAHRPELASRIVFLTGDSTNEETELFLKKTASRHLGKPFDLSRVEQLISEILTERSAAVAV